jgi:hypothetical protein
VQVHLEAEHFAQVLLGGGRQADAFREYLIVRHQHDRLLDLARDICLLGVRRVEPQA